MLKSGRRWREVERRARATVQEVGRGWTPNDLTGGLERTPLGRIVQTEWRTRGYHALLLWRIFCSL